MSFLDKVTAFLPLGKKEQDLEYFFAINIGTESLTAALWTVESRQLKILSTASESYSSNDEIIAVSDKLLDQVLGLKEIEPQKILFGVPASWLSDDNLKDEYLKILRSFVKELELTPMAYVSTSNALIHFLEKQEGIPTTAILVGFQKLHLTVTIVRAGKLDGVKVIKRGENSGTDIEKALLTFTDIETLPSKILIYGPSAGGLKSQLSSFTWMSKLSFLHLPKIDELGQDLEIKSICLAGGSEINGNISYSDHEVEKYIEKVAIEETGVEVNTNKEQVLETGDNFGFVVGDIDKGEPIVVNPEEHSLEIDDFEKDLEQPVSIETEHKQKFNLKRLIPIGVAGVAVLLALVYLLLVKADVKIFVEPKIIEKDAQVVADPNQKTVDESSKIIPGQMAEIEVSGSAKDTASGKRQIGDPAKGTVVIINNTAQGQNFSAGTTLISSGGIKFKLDNTASVSATLSDSASKSTVTTQVTAVVIGADGNIPSETKLTIGNFKADQFVGKTQGNFSGGTSKDVTVVSSEDQQKLLAKLSSDLRQQAQQKLQEKYPNKKILKEALLESIARKSYSKNINDQASEFSLNMTISYKGTAFDDTDLRTIVSKLVNLQAPEGFTLDLSATETQADVSKLEKDGKLIFLAKFKAKFLPKIDTDKIKNQIKFKTPDQVTDILKSMDNILGSEISLTPNLPKPLSRLPLLIKNIKIEIGVK
ncbi:hypothetical protein A3I48_03885 [Candidatus Daviesbacteria bacterium RIFCSPLOWO2_02_FULL_36_7]|uniref:Uncharacterized protein n=1 Tax=Candidatus Daviesbacteria bacterium RIFCSPLOWO2_02_FULL_36_7 TaxID=1797792 RepID=A0A1F5MHB5_9BACT|nr:MAG: hypothetical protein A3I48_03885 [Candidatus Daviesbacteria bacterium RIFCSPLOWO2_02_FULL_36_7]